MAALTYSVMHEQEGTIQLLAAAKYPATFYCSKCWIVPSGSCITE